MSAALRACEGGPETIKIPAIECIGAAHGWMSCPRHRATDGDRAMMTGMMMPMQMPMSGMMNPMMMPMGGMMNPMMMGMPMTMPGMMPPMMCRMSCEMTADGMKCCMMPMEGTSMETFTECCNRMMAMMAAGMPMMMMCGGMPMMMMMPAMPKMAMAKSA